MYFIAFLALSMLCFHKETKADDAVDIAVKVFLKLGTIEGGGQEQFRLFLYFSGGYILVRSLRVSASTR